MIEEVRALLVLFGRFAEKGTLPNSIVGEDASNRDTSDAPLWYGVVCEELAALVRERDSVAPRFRIHCEADGQRPREAAREVQVLDDAEVILASHESFERRQRAARDHVEVGELA